MNMWKAVVSHPRDGEYVVVIEYVDNEGRRITCYPVITIPCGGYEHAQSVAKAYNC